jgi:hypothetical protein
VTTKIAIVERLGEKAILLPSLLGEALAANDRIKTRLSVLQDAAARAQDPGSPRLRENLRRSMPAAEGDQIELRDIGKLSSANAAAARV